VQLALADSANVYVSSNPGALPLWHYYFRTTFKGLSWSPTSCYGLLNITGMPGSAAQFSPDSLTELSYAVELAVSERCCAAIVQLSEILDVGNSTLSWKVSFAPGWLTDSSPFASSHLDLILADALGAAALLTAVQRAFPSVKAVSYAALNSTLPAVGNATSHLESSFPADMRLRNAVVALAAALCVTAATSATLFVILLRQKWTSTGTGKSLVHETSAVVAPITSAAADVFISYRRADLAVADTLVDQLSLAGLRVFLDRTGMMAGRPFDEELHRAVRDSRLMCAVITVHFMCTLADMTEHRVDYSLFELILAVHYQRRRPGRHIFPLLIGNQDGGSRDYLLTNTEFMACKASLPDIVPSATLALVSRLLADGGEELDFMLQDMTVRKLFVGKSGGAFPGLLSIAPVSIHGPNEHTNLLLRHLCAERFLTALGRRASVL